MKKFHIALFTIIIGISPVFSQINLDTNFGIAGKTVTPISSGQDQIYGTAIQADGKILTVGTSRINSKYYVVLTRYNANGSLDTFFGTSGIIITDLYTATLESPTLEIQNDGKILVGGTTEFPEYNYTFAMIRFHTDGTIDTGFGNNGTVITDFSPGNGGANGAKDIIQDGNKLIVVGFTNDIEGRNFGIAKYNLDGTLDTTFGTDGQVMINVGVTASWSDTATSVKLQSNGKIVVAGHTETVVNGNTNDFHDLAIIRLNIDGTLDTTFDSDGKVVYDFGENERNFAMVLTPDDKIIVAGIRYFNQSQNSDSIIVKLNSDGSLDTTFGTNGKLINRTNPSQMKESLNSIALTSDNKILCGGTVINNTPNADFLLMRFNSNGTSDMTFNTNGYYYGDFNVSSDASNAIAIQNDGKIILAGATNINGNVDFAIARYVVGTLHNEVFESNNFTIYPNPTSSLLTISNDENDLIRTVEIYDLSGKLIKTNPVINNMIIDVSNLDSGTYFIKINTDNISKITKFIKN